MYNFIFDFYFFLSTRNINIKSLFFIFIFFPFLIIPLCRLNDKSLSQRYFNINRFLVGFFWLQFVRWTILAKTIGCQGRIYCIHKAPFFQFNFPFSVFLLAIIVLTMILYLSMMAIDGGWQRNASVGIYLSFYILFPVSRLSNIPCCNRP